MERYVFEETMETLRLFITDIDAAYKGELVMSNGEKGFMIMRFTEQGNHSVLFHIDPDTDTLTVDYYPQYHMSDFSNIQAHRSVEILNTLINEVKVHVADNRAVYFSASLELSENSVSLEKIENLYSCCLFINKTYGDVLEECMTRPIPGKDYQEEIHSAIINMFDSLIKMIEEELDGNDDDDELLDDFEPEIAFVDPDDDIKLASEDGALEIDPEELM